MLLVALVLFSVLAAFSQAGPVTPPTSMPMISGPCRAWLFPCGRGSWVCTTETAYWKFIYGPKPECPALYPQTTAPPPGECQLKNGICQFTDSALNCKTSVNQLSGNICGSASEYDHDVSYGSLDSKHFGQYPAPNKLCLPINETCQWYDPCLYWRGFCEINYTCGTADEYYAFLYGPRPSCTPPSPGLIPHAPPGQCAIKRDHCDWYECTSWLDWCQFNWFCGTVYDKETYEAGPPPPCPAPPPNHHPPTMPGTCRFNVSSGQCNFFSNNTECVSWVDKCGSSWLCGTILEKDIYENLPHVPCPLPPHPPVKPGICKLNISSGQCSFFQNKKTNPCNQPIYPPGYKPSCAMLEQQWTFNSTIGQCVTFAYSPCGEEREGYDVFATQEECVKTCIHQDPCHQSIYPPGFIPRCDVLQKQWTYNTSTGQCVEFYYHPCGEDRDGYDVFASEEECARTCLHRDPCKQSIYPPGYIPSCMVVQKQWTYNQTTQKCVEFNYHPCGEARDGYNVFDTEEDCTRTCIHQLDPCHQPIYPSSFKPTCRILVKQWTYNPMTGNCVEFEYSPCGEYKEGYDVFATETDCTNTCVH